MIPSANERRKETRHPASGLVRLVVDYPVAKEIDGDLLDISNVGFRAAHHHLSMHAGQEVEFSHTNKSGRARAMWTRIVAGRMEAGFLIL